MEFRTASPISRCLLLTACLVLATSAAAQQEGGQAKAKVYRWVDDKGEVHFSETVPPDVKDERQELQKKTGDVWKKDRTLQPPPPPKPKPTKQNELPRDSSGLQRPTPRYNAAQLKAQQDALLLLRYDSDQEIIDAMQVEIKQLDYDRRVLTTSKTSLTQAYLGNIREAAERQRAGIKLEDKLVREIQSLKQRLAANEASIDGLKLREDSVRKAFEAELDRYRGLVAAESDAND